MADFRAEVFQNEFMPEGDVDVHAIVRFTCDNPPTAPGEASGLTAELLIIDCSGSMRGDAMVQASRAAEAALDAMPDGVLFAVVAGNHAARPVYSVGGALARMDAGTRRQAKRAVEGLRPDGGTAMGTWLQLARAMFADLPAGTRRHAILLTDGINEHETPEALKLAIEESRGAFECDCRGVGPRWQVDEVRKIAEALLGTVGLVRRPEDLAAEFTAMARDSAQRSSAEVQLKVWSPQGARLVFLKQVFPTLDDLTSRRSAVNPLTGSYPTTSWRAEARDYHVCVRLPARSVGEEQLAARVQLCVGSEVLAQGLVKARWSDDETATSQIDPQVAHYTGRAEMAQAIQDGLAAKQAGHEDEATSLLKRAADLAAAADDEETTTRLRKLIDIDADGTTRLRRSVDRLDEMELDVQSTKTVRVRHNRVGS